MTERFSNNATSTLSLGVTDATGFVQVVSNAPFPTSPTFRIRVEDEIMLVTAVAGSIFTVTRGAEGTAAAAHSSGAGVYHVLTAGAIQQLANDIVALSNSDVATWRARLAWYVHPVSGDDTNDGGTDTAPLRTFSELARRLSLCPKNRPLGRENGEAEAQVLVYVMDSAAVSGIAAPVVDRPKFDGLPTGTQIVLLPHPDAVTVLGTGTVTTVQAASSAAGQHIEIEAAALAATWTASGYVQKLVRITKITSPAYGAVAAVVLDMGGSRRARMTRFCTREGVYGSFATPQVGDTFEVLDVPSVPAIGTTGSHWNAMVCTHMLVQTLDWWFEVGSGVSSTTTSVSCVYLGNAGGGYMNVLPDGSLATYGCLFAGTVTNSVEIDVWQKAQMTNFGSAFLGSWTSVYLYGDQSNVWLYRNTLLQSGANIYQTASNVGSTIYVSDLAVYDSTVQSIDCSGGHVVILYASASYAGYVYGTGNGQPVFRLGSWAKMSYYDKARITVTMTGLVKPFRFGASTDKNAADLPFIDNASAAASQAGAVALV